MPTVMTVREEDYNGEWNAPCSVEICLNNVDHAYMLVSALNTLFNKAAGGGDMEINGIYVGHDIGCSKINLYLGCNKEEE